jgi:hypothetical protein
MICALDLGAGHGPMGQVPTSTDEEPEMNESRPPLPPFTEETARQKVLAAEAAWNTRDPARIAAAYTVDSVRRTRGEFITRRDEIEAFLTRKWERELEYALRKDRWTFDRDRIACASSTSPRRRRKLGAFLRQRALGVRPQRAHASARGQHQRREDLGNRTADLRPTRGGRLKRDPAPLNR